MAHAVATTSFFKRTNRINFTQSLSHFSDQIRDAKMRRNDETNGLKKEKNRNAGKSQRSTNLRTSTSSRNEKAGDDRQNSTFNIL